MEFDELLQLLKLKSRSSTDQRLILFIKKLHGTAKTDFTQSEDFKKVVKKTYKAIEKDVDHFYVHVQKFACLLKENQQGKKRKTLTSDEGPSKRPCLSDFSDLSEKSNDATSKTGTPDKGPSPLLEGRQSETPGTSKESPKKDTVVSEPPLISDVAAAGLVVQVSSGPMVSETASELIKSCETSETRPDKSCDSISNSGQPSAFTKVIGGTDDNSDERKDSKSLEKESEKFPRSQENDETFTIETAVDRMVSEVVSAVETGEVDMDTNSVTMISSGSNSNVVTPTSDLLRGDSPTNVLDENVMTPRKSKLCGIDVRPPSSLSQGCTAEIYTDVDHDFDLEPCDSQKRPESVTLVSDKIDYEVISARKRDDDVIRDNGSMKRTAVVMIYRIDDVNPTHPAFREKPSKTARSRRRRLTPSSGPSRSPSPEPSTSHGMTSSPSKEEREKEKRKLVKGNEKQVRKLEKMLKQLNKAIAHLQEREISMDDMDAEDSYYIQEDKLKARAVKVWKKLCELHGAPAGAGRKADKKFRYAGTRYPEINRAIERFVNKRKFPDIHDVKDIVKKASDKFHLRFSVKMIRQTAQTVFLEVGKMLQRRRMEDFTMDFGCELTDTVVDDPAKDDEPLKEQLDENYKISSKNLDEVFAKYTHRQEEGCDFSDDYVNPSEEEEDVYRKSKDKSPPSTSKKDPSSTEKNEECIVPAGDMTVDYTKEKAPSENVEKSKEKVVAKEQLDDAKRNRKGKESDDSDSSDEELPAFDVSISKSDKVDSLTKSTVDDKILADSTTKSVSSPMKVDNPKKNAENEPEKGEIANSSDKKRRIGLTKISGEKLSTSNAKEVLDLTDSDIEPMECVEEEVEEEEEEDEDEEEFKEDEKEDERLIEEAILGISDDESEISEHEDDDTNIELLVESLVDTISPQKSAKKDIATTEKKAVEVVSSPRKDSETLDWKILSLKEAFDPSAGLKKSGSPSSIAKNVVDCEKNIEGPLAVSSPKKVVQVDSPAKVVAEGAKKEDCTPKTLIVDVTPQKGKPTDPIILLSPSNSEIMISDSPCKPAEPVSNGVAKATEFVAKHAASAILKTNTTNATYVVPKMASIVKAAGNTAPKSPMTTVAKATSAISVPSNIVKQQTPKPATSAAGVARIPQPAIATPLASIATTSAAGQTEWTDVVSQLISGTNPSMPLPTGVRSTTTQKQKMQRLQQQNALQQQKALQQRKALEQLASLKRAPNLQQNNAQSSQQNSKLARVNPKSTAVPNQIINQRLGSKMTTMGLANAQGVQGAGGVQVMRAHSQATSAPMAKKVQMAQFPPYSGQGKAALTPSPAGGPVPVGGPIRASEFQKMAPGSKVNKVLKQAQNAVVKKTMKTFQTPPNSVQRNNVLGNVAQNTANQNQNVVRTGQVVMKSAGGQYAKVGHNVVKVGPTTNVGHNSTLQPGPRMVNKSQNVMTQGNNVMQPCQVVRKSVQNVVRKVLVSQPHSSLQNSNKTASAGRSVAAANTSGLEVSVRTFRAGNMGADDDNDDVTSKGPITIEDSPLASKPTKSGDDRLLNAGNISPIDFSDSDSEIVDGSKSCHRKLNFGTKTSNFQPSVTSTVMKPKSASTVTNRPNISLVSKQTNSPQMVSRNSPGVSTKNAQNTSLSKASIVSQKLSSFPPKAKEKGDAVIVLSDSE